MNSSNRIDPYLSHLGKDVESMYRQVGASNPISQFFLEVAAFMEAHGIQRVSALLQRKTLSSELLTRDGVGLLLALELENAVPGGLRSWARGMERRLPQYQATGNWPELKMLSSDPPERIEREKRRDMAVIPFLDKQLLKAPVPA